MAKEKVDLIKDVYSKTQYTQTIDNRFEELGVSSIVNDLQNQPTVEAFFNLYNELFYDIPPNGDTNSHEFLAIQSGEYVGFNRNNEEIEALQAEIVQLRKDLLASQISNVEQETGQSLDIDLENLGNNTDEVNQTLTQIQTEVQSSTNSNTTS